VPGISRGVSPEPKGLTKVKESDERDRHVTNDYPNEGVILGEACAAGGQVDDRKGENAESNSHSAAGNRQLETGFPLAILQQSHRGLFGRNLHQFSLGVDVLRRHLHRSRQTQTVRVRVHPLASGFSDEQPFQRWSPPPFRTSEYLRAKKTTLPVLPIALVGMIPESLGQARID